jgi:hypothetical protein
MKKVMHNTDKQYVGSSIYQIFTSDMHNLKSKFDKLFNNSITDKPINLLKYVLAS